jgi:alpha-tubulin suppressor-like RCC1 family protein
MQLKTQGSENGSLSPGNGDTFSLHPAQVLTVGWHFLRLRKKRNVMQIAVDRFANCRCCFERFYLFWCPETQKVMKRGGAGRSAQKDPAHGFLIGGYDKTSTTAQFREDLALTISEIGC